MRNAFVGVQQLLKMKTPPDRAGLNFAVGAQLEARDKHNKWYCGSIQQLDTENQQVLVQYCRWSKRCQEWFHWDSPHIRGLDRVSLRKQGLDHTDQKPLYSVGSKVMACWTDCKFYPAKVLKVNKDESYTVRFFDGVVRTVRPLKIKPYDENWKKDNSSEEWDSNSDVETDGEEAVKEDVSKKESEEGAEDHHIEDKNAKEDTGHREEEEGKPGSEQRQNDEQKCDEVNMKHIVEGNEDDKKDQCGDGVGKEVESNVEKSMEVQERQRKRRADILRDARAKRKRIGKRRSTQVPAPVDQDQRIKEDSTEVGPAQVNREVLLERQAHLPTTHKFSREPLYRVIKRQPPPILSIELDHNEFKCPAPNCSKSFRKSSLLHCHLKYYHTSAVQSTTVTTGREKRKRLSSEGISDASDAKPDPGISRLEQGETAALETGPKTDPDRIMRKERSRNRKHFLRVKLKKKKKKKKKRRSRHTVLCCSDDENLDHPQRPIDLELPLPGSSPHRGAAEEGSDWSTLTAESGEDSITWPFSAEMESDVVRCVCEVDEENDFMIQCSQCRCWQHGTCLGLLEHHQPQSYTCFTCRGAVLSPDWSVSRRKACSDWLMTGHMFGLSCVGENFSEQNMEQIALTRRLLAHTCTIATVTAAIGLKLRLLQSGSGSELRFWRLPWRREEGEGPKVVCYVSSEHCYQKPAVTQVTPEEMETEPEQNPRPLRPSETCKTPQLNLLDHIETLQQEIISRLERMETELDGLESWMDDLESADPLSRLPELKQQIRRLLQDLSTVRQLSACC